MDKIYVSRLSSFNVRPLHLIGHDDADDYSVKAKCTSKDLNNEHGYESCRILCSSLCSAGSHNSNRYSASEVTHADNHADSEHAEASVFSLLPVD